MLVNLPINGSIFSKKKKKKALFLFSFSLFSMSTAIANRKSYQELVEKKLLCLPWIYSKCE